MCVSTGIAGIPSEKQRMIAAVLGPIPLSRFSHALASASGISARNDRSNPPISSRICRSTLRIRGAFCLASPPLRIASSIASTEASATASSVPNVAIRLLNARSEFKSEVCCDNMV